MKHKQPPRPTTGDPFADSIHTLSPSDIVRPKSAGKKGSLTGKLIRLGALALCLCVLTASLISIAESLADYKVADDYYDDLANLWGDLSPDGSNPFGPAALAYKNGADEATPAYGVELPPKTDSGPNVGAADSALMLQIRAKLNALKERNGDLLGWITIPNTKIDYPVVHTTDNEYYLNHSFDRDYLRAGAIFADYRNSKNLSLNKNTVIYGHNMSSGAMFACISDFFSRSYFMENRYIYIYTENGIYVYKTFSIRKIRVDKDVSYITTYFATGDKFVQFSTKQLNASAVKPGDVTFSENDSIITLSTCTNAHRDTERYSLQAVLVEIQK